MALIDTGSFQRVELSSTLANKLALQREETSATQTRYTGRGNVQTATVKEFAIGEARRVVRVSRIESRAGRRRHDRRSGDSVPLRYRRAAHDDRRAAGREAMKKGVHASAVIGNTLLMKYIVRLSPSAHAISLFATMTE